MNYVIFNNEKVYPTKIVCVGRNYVEHIKELNNELPEDIVLFIKPNSSISLEIYKPKKTFRYEGEISFIIKEEKIVGVGFGIDLTLVEEQEKAKKKGLPWEKAKAFDNSAVFSEFVPIDDVLDLSMELYINNSLKQKGDISLMIFKPEDILKKIQKYFSLEDYDIIMTGTPKGVGSFSIGDKVKGRILKGNKVLVEKEWTVLG